jgi:hypothetical protein
MVQGSGFGHDSAEPASWERRREGGGRGRKRLGNTGRQTETGHVSYNSDDLFHLLLSPKVWKFGVASKL